MNEPTITVHEAYDLLKSGCDEFCFYGCTKAGQQRPECLNQYTFDLDMEIYNMRIALDSRMNILAAMMKYQVAELNSKYDLTDPYQYIIDSYIDSYLKS